MMQTFHIIFVCQLFFLAGATESGIVGGKVSKPHSRPYMASLQYNGTHSCGGILIRKDFVLTAAHCKLQQDMTVVLGAHNLSKHEESQQRIGVAEYHQHPNYNRKLDYDIMLLKLKDNAKMDDYVKTIELPKKNKETAAGVKCVVAGWGHIAAQGPASDVLKETTEMTQFNSVCNKIWQQYFESDRMICTKFNKKDGGICQGDSGGPLICNNKARGLVSFTYKNDCNDPKYPHVFTKISFFLPWIKRVMGRYRNVTRATIQ